MKLPHMPLYVFDLESDRDCRAMSDAEFGRYMRLLIRQWVEGDVPGDAQSAIRDAMLDPESAESVQSLLDRKFPRIEGGRRANQKLADLRAETMEKVEQWRENGSRGGRPRKNQEDNQADNQNKTKRFSRASGSGSGSGSRSAQGKGGSGGKGKRAKERPDADDIDLPPPLQSEAFRAAWRDWFQHRRERNQPLTTTAAKQAIRKLEAMGHDRAIAAIEHSVSNGYQGVFEPSGGAKPASRGSGGPGRLRAPAGKYDGIGAPKAQDASRSGSNADDGQGPGQGVDPG